MESTNSLGERGGRDKKAHSDSNSGNSLESHPEHPSLQPIPPTREAQEPPRSSLSRPPDAIPRSQAAANTSAFLSASPARQSTLSPTSTVDYTEIELKQNELRHAVEYRVTALERCLADREEEIVRLKHRLQKLEEDYQFNYSLIGERDAALSEASSQLQRLYRELKQATATGGTLEAQLETKTNELLELRERLREVELEKDELRRRLEKEFSIKEEHLFSTMQTQRKELEEERDREHREYLTKMREMDKNRQEMENRHQEILKETKDRLNSRLESIEAELRSKTAEAEGLQRSLAEEQKRSAGLQQQQWMLEQKHVSTTEELKQLKNWIDGRQEELKENTSLETIANLEQALREEVRKSSRLDLEKTRLQSELTDLQQSLQRAQKARETDSAKHLSECQELRQNYESASAAMEELRRKWSETEHRLQSTILEQAKQTATSEAELRRALETARVDKEQLEEIRVLKSRLEHEVEGLRKEARLWKEEVERTAKVAREEKTTAEETILALQRKLQDLQSSHDALRRQVLETEEKHQTEVVRLTRELHASEAAREALEDQFHLFEDTDHQTALVKSLRADKETLLGQVEELTRINGEIQQQVTNFTLELQNDPLVEKAKETQQKVVVLESELQEVKEERDTLKDTLKEKEEEIARYQMEVLRAQVIMDSTGGKSGKFSSFPGGKLSQASSLGLLSEEYQALRQSYDEVRRQLKRERRRGAKRKERGKHSSKGEIEMSSEEDSDSTDHSMEATSARKSKDFYRDPSSSSIQEVEVWRQKSLQLEQHVRVLLSEREALKKEVSRYQMMEVNLQSEKQSLLNLNSLLKSQLREACRMALPAPSATTATAPSFSSPPPTMKERTSRTPDRTVDRPTPYLDAGGGTLAVDSLSGLNRSPSTIRQPAAENQRLVTLEEEINAIKRQIMETAEHRAAGHRTTTTTTAAASPSRQSHGPRGGQRTSENRGVVRRKGDSVVRNYAQPF